MSEDSSEKEFLRIWKEATDAFDQDGLAAALGVLAVADLDNVNSACLRTNLLTLAGQHYRAFTELKPHLDDIESEAKSFKLLALSQTALFAGEREEAERLLIKGMPKGRGTFEDIRTALSLAQRLYLTDLVDRLRTMLGRWYPDHPSTLDQQWWAAAEREDFATCQSMAERINDPFRTAAARYWLTTPANPSAFLAQVSLLGRSEDGLWFLANDANRRGRFAEARRFAKQISPESTQYARAIELWAGTLRKEFPPLEPEKLLPELAELFGYCAAHPGDLEARFAVERIAESDSCGTAAQAALVKLLIDEIKRLTDLLPTTFAMPMSIIEQEHETHKEVAFLEICRRLCESVRDSKIVMGYGEIPPDIAATISPNFLAMLGVLIQTDLKEGEWDNVYLLLHFSILTARTLEDPVSDLQLASVTLTWLAQSGSTQQARDVAEMMLLVLPATQPEEAASRRAQAWFMFGDVWLRSHNPFEALNCVLRGCLEIRIAPTNPGLMANVFRICAQTLRDLQFYWAARIAITAEDSIVQSHPHLAYRRIDVQQMNLTVRFGELGVHPTENELNALGLEAIALLSGEIKESEVAPILRILANAIHLLRCHGWTVPAGLTTAFDAHLSRAMEPTRPQLAALVQGDSVSVASLYALLESLGDARSSQDIRHQIRPAAEPAHAALGKAIDDNDLFLFGLAHSILAQPALTLSELRRERLNTPPENLASFRSIADRIAGNEGSEDVIDAIRLQRSNIDRMVPLNFSVLGNTSHQEWQRELKPGETMMLIGSDRERALAVWLISAAVFGNPVRVPLEQWDRDTLNKWRMAFPEGYQLKYFFRSIGKPEPTTVAESLRNLNPFIPCEGKHLIIVPESDLFGFTFSLAAKIHGCSLPISIAPSASWISIKRTRRNREQTGRIAWLGGNGVDNDDLLSLRQGMVQPLEVGGFEIDLGNSPENCSNRQLVLIGSHGGLMEGTFSHVTDKKEYFSADQLAATLADTRCVILIVCHGGQVDRHRFSEETRGLVSSLLRYGVDCVVAPPWPIYVDLAVQWFERFIATDSTSPVVARVDDSLSSLALQYENHPVVRSLLTVYGDGGICLD